MIDMNFRLKLYIDIILYISHQFTVKGNLALRAIFKPSKSGKNYVKCCNFHFIKVPKVPSC